LTLVLMLIIGAAAGFVATRAMGMELPILTTIAVGILGSFVGWVILKILLSLFSVATGFIGAVIGALLLLWLYNTCIKKE
jgi:uncharacterized membrane protein YeaQ/YmgE (transglycosylase-associated protein family)